MYGDTAATGSLRKPVNNASPILSASSGILQIKRIGHVYGVTWQLRIKTKVVSATWCQAHCNEIKLSDVQLTDVKLTDAKLADAKLTDAKLTDVKLTDVKLTDAKLNDVKQC